MPKLEIGDLESVEHLKDINIPQLARLARGGYAILTPIPSCTLMFKQELPLMFPDDADVQAVKQAMWDPFEYLVARHRDGLLKTDFKRPLGTVSYHVPCHGRVQNIGRKTEELLKLLPQTQVNTVERCSGHSGTLGHTQGVPRHGDEDRQAGVQEHGRAQPDFISSDCQLAGRHIEQGIERHARRGARRQEAGGRPSPVARAPGVRHLERKEYWS